MKVGRALPRISATHLPSFVSSALIIWLLLLGTSFVRAETVEVLSPNGGEQWPVGSKQKVRWNYSGSDSNYAFVFIWRDGIAKKVGEVKANEQEFTWFGLPHRYSKGSYRLAVHVRAITSMAAGFSHHLVKAVNRDFFSWG